MNRTPIVACVMFALACSSSKDAEPPAPPITYQEAPSVEPVKAQELAPTAADVPVAEDFDEESETQINTDNFRGELERLEAEINADSTP